jgi:hypothetical protein
MSGKHHKPPRWRRGREGKQQEPRPRRFLTEMVDGTGSAHLLTTDAFEQGLREGTGRYQTLCGRQITPTSMTIPPSKYCRPCVVLRPPA